jgi:3-oxoacyl-[acyl-carrier-protein] synthase-1
MTCLVGAGAHTPVGWTLAESAAAVRAGMSRVEEHPDLIESGGEPLSAAMASWLGSELTVSERFVRLGRRAAREALVGSLRGSTLARGLGEVRLRCLLALPEARPGLPEDLGAALAARFEAVLARWGAKVAVTTAPLGHAAGLAALRSAGEALTSGEADLCLVGGIESYLSPDTVTWLEEAGQLRTEEVRHGFVPGEGAGFCLLASEALAERHRLRVLARVAGGGVAEERNRIKTETVCTGEGMTAAFEEALSALPEGEKVDGWICDLNGEAYRTDELGFTLAKTGQRFREPGVFLAPADAWGDVGAASGPLFLGLVAAAVKRGYCRARHTLLSAGSEGGLRAAVLVRTEPSARGER